MMTNTSLSSQWQQVRLPYRCPNGPSLVVSTQLLDHCGQVHYMFDFERQCGIRINIDLADYVSRASAGSWCPTGVLPLALPRPEQWIAFCIGPHSVTPLTKNLFLVGQRAFDRFIGFNIGDRSAYLIDPGVGEHFLSCSNWFDRENGELWFASWDIEDTFCRTSDPLYPVRIKIWRRSLKEEHSSEVWAGRGGDFLHQLNMSDDRRLLVLCEMGMRPSLAVPPGHPGTYPSEWKNFQLNGVIPSEVIVLDLVFGREWRLPLPIATAAHVEFDPCNPHRFYVSCHNMGLVNGSNILFGPGAVYRFDLQSNGPQQTGVYTGNDFYRITTHHLIRHHGRTLMAVTGFPDSIFLIDVETMTLHRKIALFVGDPVDTDSRPHFCKQEPRSPYSLHSSADGIDLYVVGNGVLFLVEVATGRLKEPPWSFYPDSDRETVTGHVTVY